MNNHQTIGDISDSHVIGVNNYSTYNGRERTSNSLKTHRTVLYALCIAAIILSTIALSQAFPRSQAVDYIGLITGIFAFITAVLMWWNVYALIDVKSMKEEMTRRDAAMKRYIEDEINRGLIQEESTSVNTFWKEYGWMRMLPLMKNLSLRIIRLCKSFDRNEEIDSFVCMVGQMINEIKDEEIRDSELTGFMTLFKELEPYNGRVALVFSEYERKKRGHPSSLEYMSPS